MDIGQVSPDGFPEIAQVMLRKHKAIRRALSDRATLGAIRVAVLGGTTTNEVTDLLELLLLREGIRPTLYQSDYNRYFEEAVVDSARLVAFKPDVVIVYATAFNVQFPPMGLGESAWADYLEHEVGRFEAIWNSLDQQLTSVIVQCNLDPPATQLLGNLDAVAPSGRVRFVNAMNMRLAQAARDRKKLYISDIASAVSRLGQDRFLDLKRWFSYKICTSPEGSLEVARSWAAILRTVCGRARKCLVLDLDNTLWGGVVGDDGPENLAIGRETPLAEAYSYFQQYCFSMRERGILLAVCSKNDASIALKGLEHPESLLRVHHFASFKANWQPKPENIEQIAQELNIGLDSLVFVDDNPAERAIVRAQLPMVAVPEVGSDVSDYASIIDRQGYFEAIAISQEDMARSDSYADNARRVVAQARFADYGEYLAYLQMTAEIGRFKDVYLDRITQLTNKTNQYNLTTKRYSRAEIDAVAADPGKIAIYGKLADRYGDSGLISVVVGNLDNGVLHIELWLMSCRVLKRDMEFAMLDHLVRASQQGGVREVRGYFYRTPKNNLVTDHYARLGFEVTSRKGDDESVWSLDLTRGYTPRNRYIKESRDE